MFNISVFPGFCALLVAAPTFHLVQMRRSLLSGKTRWPPVFLLSQRTHMLIEGTTRQVLSTPSPNIWRFCLKAYYLLSHIHGRHKVFTAGSTLPARPKESSSPYRLLKTSDSFELIRLSSFVSSDATWHNRIGLGAQRTNGFLSLDIQSLVFLLLEGYSQACRDLKYSCRIELSKVLIRSQCFLKYLKISLYC